MLTCSPHPSPTDNIAEGADHDPSDLLETTRPVPTLYVTSAPALATVSMASPFAPLSTAEGIEFSGFNLPTCILVTIFFFLSNMDEKLKKLETQEKAKKRKRKEFLPGNNFSKYLRTYISHIPLISQ